MGDKSTAGLRAASAYQFVRDGYRRPARIERGRIAGGEGHALDIDLAKARLKTMANDRWNVSVVSRSARVRAASISTMDQVRRRENSLHRFAGPQVRREK
jgi:hypothetical protein